jgi:hypothetical protein
MTENTALLEKREELKRQLAAGEYKTVLDKLLDETGCFLQKLTRNPEIGPFWFSAIIIALLTVLIGLSTSRVFGEDLWVVHTVGGAGIALVTVIALRIYSRILFTTLAEKILDTLESVADLADLQCWLTDVCHVKKTLCFTLSWIVFVNVCAVTAFYIRENGGFIGFGYMIMLVIVHFQLGIGAYFLLLHLVLPFRLSHYQFKLYATDPSSSKCIDDLSDILSDFMYVLAIVAAIVTAYFTLFKTWPVKYFIAHLLLVWGGLTVLFFANRYALDKIIMRSKWNTLKAIQAQIETLQTQEEILSEKTLEHISKLMDYHERIKTTRNPPLNIRTTLMFLNSLLLPLLAAVLSQLEKIKQILNFFQSF